MKINEVEALVGITRKNIRFYESEGLLAPRRNSENGYRDYGEDEVRVLLQIKLLRKLGVPLEEIRKMQEKAAAQAMVSDVNKYQQVAMADALGKGGSRGGGVASDMVQLQMGMAMGQQMVQGMMGQGIMNQGAVPQSQAAPAGGTTPLPAVSPKFCPNCGTPTTGTKFCGNCGSQLFA